MVFVVLYSVTNTKQTVGDRLIIDENLIMATNNVESSFKRQTNALFESKTVNDIKGMFMNTLSDTPNIDKCASAEDKDLVIPETYDWRQQYPECVRPV